MQQPSDACMKPVRSCLHNPTHACMLARNTRKPQTGALRRSPGDRCARARLASPLGVRLETMGGGSWYASRPARPGSIPSPGEVGLRSGRSGLRLPGGTLAAEPVALDWGRSCSQPVRASCPTRPASYGRDQAANLWPARICPGSIVRSLGRGAREPATLGPLDRPGIVAGRGPAGDRQG